MRKTTNYKMNLPELQDQYNVNDFNTNTETIDTTLHNLQVEVTNDKADLKNKDKAINDKVDKVINGTTKVGIAGIADIAKKVKDDVTNESGTKVQFSRSVTALISTAGWYKIATTSGNGIISLRRDGNNWPGPESAVFAISYGRTNTNKDTRQAHITELSSTLISDNVEKTGIKKIKIDKNGNIYVYYNLSNANYMRVEVFGTALNPITPVKEESVTETLIEVNVNRTPSIDDKIIATTDGTVDKAKIIYFDSIKNISVNDVITPGEHVVEYGNIGTIQDIPEDMKGANYYRIIVKRWNIGDGGDAVQYLIGTFPNYKIRFRYGNLKSKSWKEWQEIATTDETVKRNGNTSMVSLGFTKNSEVHLIDFFKKLWDKGFKQGETIPVTWSNAEAAYLTDGESSFFVSGGGFYIYQLSNVNVNYSLAIATYTNNIGNQYNIVVRVAGGTTESIDQVTYASTVPTLAGDEIKRRFKLNDKGDELTIDLT